MTDTFSNFFSKLKNGYLSKKYKIIQSKSNKILNLLNTLLKFGFIKSYKISKKNNQIIIFLKYKKNKSILKNIKKISKPSKRVYLKNKNLFIKKPNMYILSTSKGILMDIEAKQLNLGGELICKLF